jgi:hypothetical protein
MKLIYNWREECFNFHFSCWITWQSSALKVLFCCSFNKIPIFRLSSDQISSLHQNERKILNKYKIWSMDHLLNVIFHCFVVF